MWQWNFIIPESESATPKPQNASRINPEIRHVYPNYHYFFNFTIQVFSLSIFLI